MLDVETLRKCYTLSRKWEKELVIHFPEVIGLTENEARVLVHLYKNKGSYLNRIVRLLGIKRSTVYFVLEILKQQGVVFTTVSQLTGNKIYKLADSSLTRALLATAFKLCVSDHIKRGVNVDDVLF